MLPRGYTKTRRYGGWSPPRRAAYLELCSKQLEATGALLSSDATGFGPFHEQQESVADEQGESCPGCGGRMILQAACEKPSWADIMFSPSRPAWYRILVGK